MNGEVLWTAHAAARATGGRLSGRGDWCANGVSIDSRSLERGDLFVALTGLNRDGHLFVSSALEAGAAACMVAAPAPDLSADAPLLDVEDTLRGLNDLAAAARARCTARRIAVTGSVGKTSTKEMLRHVLGRQGKAHASAASYNNIWGVPLTLARMPEHTDYGVFEIGMNHSGEITPLARLVRPHIAVITAVAPVHLEFFSGVGAIADAKAEIFDGMDGAGVAVLNADDAQFARLSAAARTCGVDVISFGSAESADARVTGIAGHGAGSAVTAIIGGMAVRYTLPEPGRHWVMNSLAVLAAAQAAGADVRRAAADLATIPALKGRGARHIVRSGFGDFTLIDESYNANPASMRAAITTLGQHMCTGTGRRLAILGDMLELGAAGPQLHIDLADSLAEAGIERVYLAGPLMRHLWEALPASRRGAWTPTSKDLADTLAPEIVSGAIVGAGDAVMVKGSLGSRMALIIQMLEQIGQGSLTQQKSG